MDNSNIFEVDPSLFSEYIASESHNETAFEPIYVYEIFTNCFITD